MFKSLKSLLVASIGIGVASTAWSTAQLETVKHFSDVNTYVQKLIHKNGAEHTLLVFDDDDTLLQMPQALGSVGWFNWQDYLLRCNASSNQLVAHNFEGLLNVQTLLYSLSGMTLVSKNTPGLLKKWQQEGATTIVMSARGHTMSNSSDRQLKAAGLFDGFMKHGLVTQTGTTSLPGYFKPCNDVAMRDVTYQNGIYSAAGQDKGVLLKCLLKRTNETSRYTSILLVDDTLKNDQQFVDAFKNDKNVDVYALHYTKLAKVKEEQCSSPKLHQQMTQQWNQIKSVLDSNLKKPF